MKKQEIIAALNRLFKKHWLEWSKEENDEYYRLVKAAGRLMLDRPENQYSNPYYIRQPFISLNELPC